MKPQMNTDPTSDLRDQTSDLNPESLRSEV